MVKMMVLPQVLHSYSVRLRNEQPALTCTTHITHESTRHLPHIWSWFFEQTLKKLEGINWEMTADLQK